MKRRFARKPAPPSDKENSRRGQRIVCGGGPGVGAPCEICGLPITKSEKEFQIEFEQDGGGGLDKFHVHIRCFAAWEFERRSASP